MSNQTGLDKIRIVIVDDQTTIREALKVLLALQPDFDIIGTAANGERAIELIQSLHPDIALIDIEMPGMNGIEVTQALRQMAPATRILVLSSHDDSQYLSKAFQSGAQGYLLKDTPSEDLATAVRSVYKGYSQVSPGLMAKVIAQLGQTSPDPLSGDRSGDDRSPDLSLDSFPDLDSLLDFEPDFEADFEPDPIRVSLAQARAKIQQLQQISDRFSYLARSITQLNTGFRQIQSLLQEAKE
jgi:DNA-binding NarL/FixJ family response regulator